MNSSLSTYLDITNAASKKEKTAKELSEIFASVAKIADEVKDPELKAKLLVAAAIGQEKLKNL